MNLTTIYRAVEIAAERDPSPQTWRQYCSLRSGLINRLVKADYMRVQGVPVPNRDGDAVGRGSDD